MSSILKAINEEASEIDQLQRKLDAVREAWNQLESAVYGLAEPFEEYVRDLQYKVEEMQMDIDDKKYELQDEPLDEVKYVDGFMGADGKPTSRPTAKDYASNKEFQHMKKKLGDRIPQPTKRDKNGKLSPFKKDEQ